MSLVKHITIGGENADIVDSRIPESNSGDQDKLLQIDSTGAFKLVTNAPSVVGISYDTTNNNLILGTQTGSPTIKLATLDPSSTVTPSQINSAVTAVASSGVTQDQMSILAGVTTAGTSAVTSNDINSLSGIASAGVVPADIKTLAGAAANGLVAADLTKLAAIDSTAADVNLLNGTQAAGLTTNDLKTLAGAAANGLVVADLTKLANIDATAAEINALNGSGIVKADLEKLHGVTASAAEISTLAGSGITNADLVKVHDITATASELNVLDGITATTAELNYMDGVTSNVQTQLNDITTDIGTVPSGKTLQGEIDTLNGDASTAGSVANTATTITTAAINALDKENTNDSALKTVDKITQVDGVVTATFKDISEMTAATSSTAGVKGLVPASAAGEQNKLLTAGKTWVAVADDLTTDSATQPLSAKQGKALSERVASLEGVGRFLSLWNASTGLPTTNPTTAEYTYHTGDYYRVGVIASGTANNYKPNGSKYVKDVPSTTVESGTLKVGDLYYYDGASWILQQAKDPDAVTDVQIQTGTGTAATVVSSGVATIKADGSTIEFNTDGKLQIKDAGITSTKLATGAVGATAISTAIVDGTISTTSGSENKIATQSTVSTAITAIPEFNPGATTPVMKGLVPTATSSDSGKYLKGDGTWADIPADALVMAATVNLAAGTFTVDKTPTEVLAARAAKTPVLIYIDTGSSYGTIMAEVTQIFTADDEYKGDFSTNITTADGQFVIAGDAGTTAYTGTLYHRPNQKSIDIQDDTGLEYTEKNPHEYDILKGVAFTGATASANGKMGMVPVPGTADVGKFLKADGNWATVDALPAQSSTTSGKFLKSKEGSTAGTYEASWETVDALPSQTGQGGKFLTTNGTTTSWSDVASIDFTRASYTVPATPSATITFPGGFSITSADALAVYQNGLLLEKTTHYTVASDLSGITLTSAPASGDIISFAAKIATGAASYVINPATKTANQYLMYNGTEWIASGISGTTASLESGTNNGTLKFTINGTATDNIAVTGLGSAAYTASTAYATSSQGSKADTALQSHQTVTLASGTNAGTLKLTVGSTETDNIAVTGLGSAAYTASTAYATSAQGAKADSALQSSDITTGSANGKINVKGTDVAVKGLGSAAYAATTDFAAASTLANKQDKLAVTGTANTPVYVSAAGTVSACTSSVISYPLATSTGTMAWNTEYRLGSISALSVAMPTPSATCSSEIRFTFTASAAFTPALTCSGYTVLGTGDVSIASGKTYEMSYAVLSSNQIGVACKEWS